MTTTNSLEIQVIPIDTITVLNPRVRNKKIFQELVTSIAHLGLKKPITVAARTDGSGYDLVCGQGRLEAYVALGQTEIPAVVIEASQEDCFVMSLVENLARRQHAPVELMREIGALRARGYSTTQIATKTDFSDEYVYAICYLLDHGEERLLAGVRGRGHSRGADGGVRTKEATGKSGPGDSPNSSTSARSRGRAAATSAEVCRSRRSG